MNRSLIVCSLALLVALPLLLAPTDADAMDFGVVRTAPTLNLDDGPVVEEGGDWEAEEAEARRHRIKAGLKIGFGSTLAVAGAALGVGAGGMFYLTDEQGGLGDQDFYGFAAGFLFTMGIVLAAAASVVVILAVVLIVQGVNHLKSARALASLDRPELRYEPKTRDQVHWGLRFAFAAPAPR